MSRICLASATLSNPPGKNNGLPPLFLPESSRPSVLPCVAFHPILGFIFQNQFSKAGRTTYRYLGVKGAKTPFPYISPNTHRWTPRVLCIVDHPPFCSCASHFSRGALFLCALQTDRRDGNYKDCVSQE